MVEAESLSGVLNALDAGTAVVDGLPLRCLGVGGFNYLGLILPLFR